MQRPIIEKIIILEFRIIIKKKSTLTDNLRCPKISSSLKT